jgi:hypothetical protein
MYSNWLYMYRANDAWRRKMPESDDSREETVRVTVAGRGIDLSREVGVSLLPRLIALLFGTSEAVAAATNTIHTDERATAREPRDVSPEERPVGPVEYLREKRPQTSSDTILVLAAYLELNEGRRPFSRDDLRRLMRSARLPEPANFPRDVGVAISKGYIQPLEDGFQLTNSALELIGRPGPLVPPRGRTGRPRRSTRQRDEGG